MEAFFALFRYDFLTRALLVGTLVSLCAALLGVSLVLKRYSMIGDGLSHVGFGALAVALVAGASPLVVAIPVVMIAAFLLLRASRNPSTRTDAAIAVLSTGALAVGVIATSLSGGVNIDINGYLFGSILATQPSDVWLSVAIALGVLTTFVLLYRSIFSITFDETFAVASGIRVGAVNLALALMTALTIVVGMRLMGTLLISSLIIFPALCAMSVMHGYRQVTICAAIVSVVCFFVGMMCSYALSLPVGASIVAVNLLVYGGFWSIGKIKKKSIGHLRILLDRGEKTGYNK